MTTTITNATIQHKPTVPLAQRLDQWRMIRHCIEGEDAIKSEGETYLPRPSGMAASENPMGDAMWRNYLARASYFGVAERTLLMLTGMVMRVDPIADVPDALRPLLDGKTGGMDINELSYWLLGELLSVNRAGVLVDMDPEASTGNMPYAATYYAESILEWKWRKRNGVKTIEYVKLAEDITGDEEVITDYDLYERYRELMLVDGVYTVKVTDVYHATDATKEPREHRRENSTTPTFRGKALDFIPFVMAPDLDDPKPTMLDLCRMSLAHYRNSADYEWGLFQTAQPTPWVTGASDGDNLKLIGSGTLWKITNPAGKVGMLEFTGAGLEAQRQAMQDKEDRMAALGAYLIRGNINRNESEQTARLRNSGETSALRKAVNNCEKVLREVYRIAAVMVGVDAATVEVVMNRDFIETALSGSELIDYVKAWQGAEKGMSGPGLSDEAFVNILKAGELVPADMTTEDAIGAIQRTGERMRESIVDNEGNESESPGNEDDSDDDDFGA